MTTRRMMRAARIVTVLCCAVAGFLTTGPVPVVGAAQQTVDGDFAGIGPVTPGGTTNLTVTGRGGVPSTGVGSVALNVTATNPTRNSFLTVYPTGQPPPNASNLNFTTGQTVPNMVIVPVGDNGQITIANYDGNTDVIVDILGWFPTGGAFTGLTPARLLDTRPGLPTVDGDFAGIGPVTPGGTTNLTVTGRGGVPSTGVGSVALNVTATNPTRNSFLTVYPTGQPPPNASNLNFTTGQTVPNMVIVPVGDNGQITIANYDGNTDVIVDILGWFPTGGAFTGLTPARLLDTRPGLPTVDGDFAGIGPVTPGGTTNLTVTGRGGVPSTGVGSVALNVTATNPTRNSFLTVYPTGQPPPNASNLNFTTGQTVPNMVIVPVGDNGQITIANYDGNTDVIVDILGWFPTGGAFTGLTPARLMDTRVPAPRPAAAIGPARNLLVVRPGLHQMSGLDRIAVWVCDIPANAPAYGSGRVSVDPVAVASWAQRVERPYFDTASRGRYQPTFTAAGRFPLAADDDPNDCLAKAQALTGPPFTNVLAVDTSDRRFGFASPGLISTSDAADIDRFAVSPSQSRRGIYVAGNLVVGDQFAPPSSSALAHEIGHTLHWPHSYVGPDSEYDDPTDVMSGTAPFLPRNTQAFNRFAAGWIDDGLVQLHRSGTNAFVLDAPGGTGVQMVAAPDAAEPHVMVTLEARPSVGPDSQFPFPGVAAYIVDQRPSACGSGGFFGACISSDRRQTKPVGGPDTFDNILKVGSTTQFYGLTVVVTSQQGSTFTVQVSGTFHAPAQIPSLSVAGSAVVASTPEAVASVA